MTAPPRQPQFRCHGRKATNYGGMIHRVWTLNNHTAAIFLLTRWVDGARRAILMIVRAMNTATFHSRLGVLGLSLRRFAAMTGVQYETARHWGVVRHGHPQEFPRWVPLMLEMMDPSVSRKPPNEAVYGHGRDQTTQGIILPSLDDPAATLADSRDRSISRRRYTAKDGLDDAD